VRSIFIALPAFGQTATTHTLASLMALAKVLIANGYDYYFSDYSYPDIADSRNMLTTIWHDRSEAAWMLQVDADMSFEPQLVLDMLECGKPLVGCLYPKKRYPIEFTGSWGALGKPKLEDGFMQVDRIGFGVTLIHRSVIAAMLESGQAQVSSPTRHVAGRLLKDFNLTRVIKAFTTVEVDGEPLSEDYSFCHRYTQSGGEVWAAIGHRITHVGQHGYSGRFADQLAVSSNASAA
jgi:hypothetical protein